MTDKTEAPGYLAGPVGPFIKRKGRAFSLE